MRTGWLPVGLLFVVLPELLALSSRAAPPRAARLPVLAARGARPCQRAVGRLRGGAGAEDQAGDGAGGADGGGGAAVGGDDTVLVDEMQKASDLLQRVNIELGETEALVQEKQAIDSTCEELQASKEKANAELARHTAALLIAAAKTGDTQSVQEALDNGAPLDFRDQDGAARCDAYPLPAASACVRACVRAAHGVCACARVCACVNARMQLLQMCARVRMPLCNAREGHEHTHTRTHTHTVHTLCMLTHISLCMFLHSDAPLRAHTHAPGNSEAHTQTHTQTHTQCCSLPVQRPVSTTGSSHECAGL